MTDVLESDPNDVVSDIMDDIENALEDSKNVNIPYGDNVYGLDESEIEDLKGNLDSLGESSQGEIGFGTQDYTNRNNVQNVKPNNSLSFSRPNFAWSNFYILHSASLSLSQPLPPKAGIQRNCLM